jgi:Ca2+-binding EF-hand superfamily protein
MERMEVDEEMDEEELAEWRTIFNLFDVDGDESITGEVKVHHLKIIPIYVLSYLTYIVNSVSENEIAT